MWNPFKKKEIKKNKKVTFIGIPGLSHQELMDLKELFYELKGDDGEYILINSEVKVVEVE